MLSRNYLREFAISALVPLNDDAEKMREIGIDPIVGTLDDHQLLRTESARADVVFNTTHCDHQASARAIIQGLEEHSTETGKGPILIHTSGAFAASHDARTRLAIIRPIAAIQPPSARTAMVRQDATPSEFVNTAVSAIASVMAP
ncbi:hypothetical protein ABIB95_000044 [Bradyrhizobium sp. LA2.1]